MNAIVRYAVARRCMHRVRLTAYTGCAAALNGGGTTTNLRGGGRYRNGPKAQLQEEFENVILLVVDEASTLSLAENGRLVDAIRTGKSSTVPLGDAAVLYLGDFGTIEGPRRSTYTTPATLESHHCCNALHSSSIPPCRGGVIGFRRKFQG